MTKDAEFADRRAPPEPLERVSRGFFITLTNFSAGLQKGLTNLKECGITETKLGTGNFNPVLKSFLRAGA